MLNVAQTNPVHDSHNREQGNKETAVFHSNPTPSGEQKAQGKDVSIYHLPELYGESSQETVKDAARKLSVSLDFFGFLLFSAIKSQMENVPSLILILIKSDLKGSFSIARAATTILQRKPSCRNWGSLG